MCTTSSENEGSLSTRSKEIECLNRLDDLNGSIAEICIFLLEERVIDKDQLEKIRRSPMKGKDLNEILNDLKINQKIQMLEYQWQVLPVEVVTIMIVTDTMKREFSYQAF